MRTSLDLKSAALLRLWELLVLGKSHVSGLGSVKEQVSVLLNQPSQLNQDSLHSVVSLPVGEAG